MKNKNEYNQIEIVNENSRKILGAEFYVRKSIKIIGIDKFDSIKKIILIDNPNSEQYRKNISQNVLIPHLKGYRVSGCYYSETSESAPYIELYISEIYRGIPFPLYLTPVMILIITQTLAHEVAHHLISKKKSSLDETREELLAERYGNYITKKLKMTPYFKICNLILRELSNWHLALAQADYKLNNLERAESHFYSAWQLNPQNQTASEWFWYVRKKLRD